MLPPSRHYLYSGTGANATGSALPAAATPPTDPHDQNRNQNPAHFDTCPCDEGGSNFCYRAVTYASYGDTGAWLYVFWEGCRVIYDWRLGF